MSKASVGARGRALLLFPLSFYSFGSALELALTAIGFQVTLANDEYPANVLGRNFSASSACSPYCRVSRSGRSGAAICPASDTISSSSSRGEAWGGR